jgi:hypothetical protein
VHQKPAWQQSLRLYTTQQLHKLHVTKLHQNRPALANQAQACLQVRTKKQRCFTAAGLAARAANVATAAKLAICTHNKRLWQLNPGGAQLAAVVRHNTTVTATGLAGVTSCQVNVEAQLLVGYHS